MNFLYPPILPSTQPAFLAEESKIDIPYSLSKMMDTSNIGHIDIKISRQRDNYNIVNKYNNDSLSNKNQHPDGIIYLRYSDTTPGKVTIRLEDVELNNWVAGEIYKIQLRFGKGELWTGFPNHLENFGPWKTAQIEAGNFGEWSNVMLIKAINVPIVNQPYVLDTSDLLPTFYGSCESEDGQEAYQFIIRLNGETIEESNWLKHTDNIDSWIPYNPLNDNTQYEIIYSIRTINGFIWNNTAYILFQSSDINQLPGITILAQPNEENGYIEVIIESTNSLTGNYIISRSTDAIHWENLKYFLVSDVTTITYRDYCIESGVSYFYGFQYENQQHYKTHRNILNEPIECYFMYSYLYSNGIQLKLKFDNTINSFKHTTLTSKQDTLGSKYPTISRNGYAYYSEFPLSGLVSYHMNDLDTFFTPKEDGLYYNNSLIIKNKDGYFPTLNPRRGLDSEISYDIDTNLSNINIYIERKFREKVEEFLNNGKYKLFKSPTEGTMIVTLINVSFSPNTSLNRMIYSFNSTAYEIAEFNSKNLVELGMHTIGEWQDITSGDYFEKIGSIRVTDSANLLATIQQQLAAENKTFSKLLNFWVDGIDSATTIMRLELGIDNTWQQIFVMPGKTYYLDDLSDSDITSLYARTSMIFNYKCSYIATTRRTTRNRAITKKLIKEYPFSGTSSFSIISADNNDESWELFSLIENQKIGENLLQQEKNHFNGDDIQQIYPNHYSNSDGSLEIDLLTLEWIELENLISDIPMTITIGDQTITYIPGPANSQIRFYPTRDQITAINFNTKPIGIQARVKMNFICREYEVSN